jgi:RNA polymerase sigma-70 factor, ECF subfamily
MEASRAAVPAARHGNVGSLLRLKPNADKAFEQLYKRHARDVYQYALALLTNPADAEDVTQTTFLNAYRALQRGDRPHRPHNWLITIAHNVCRMRWRQAGHRPREVALDDAPEPVALERGEQPSIDEVLRALSHLSFNQRSAIVMRELEGRSCKEIAEVLDLSVGAVEALLFRARQRLQVERKALGVLGTAPLPGQLASALGIGGGGGGAVTSGLAALGGDAVLKAATALVVVGAAASGAIAIAKPTTYRQVTSAAAAQAQKAHKATAPAHARTSKHHRAPGGDRGRPIPTRTPTAPAGGNTSRSAATSLTQVPPVPAPPGVHLPQVPQVPQVPQLPVQLPVQLPPVQLPDLPPVQPPDLPVQLPDLPVQVPPLPPPLPPLPPLNP